MELDALDQKAADFFEGYIVRKDLVRTFARQFPVPTYVVEFMLGRYCASTDPDEIEEGLEIVQRQADLGAHVARVLRVAFRVDGSLPRADQLARAAFDDFGLIVAELEGPVPGVYGRALHRWCLLVDVAPFSSAGMVPNSGTKDATVPK